MNNMLKADEAIEKLNSDINVKTSVIDIIRQLWTKYPDLMVYSPAAIGLDLVCCSSAVNGYVDSYDYTETQEQGGKQTISVWPYTMSGNMKVYSNPPCFYVGIANTKGFGVIPDHDWNDKLAADNVSNIVIRKVKSFLKSKPPINYTE